MTVSMKNFHASSENTLAPNQVAVLVAEARQAAGYSVEDLSVTTGLVNDEIVSIENGTDLDPGKLKRVAAALKVPVGTLRHA
ncbi:XRE family transcriptional regulator [Neorhizobium lilium]|uniref:XRE family transcriptional regulator n=2 Tax=Neorhizobium lilium TaxID=2503024 RepID=A0A444LG95_9HYPH|nr:helix-turn-helix transcriptional regulator [Neorhizobium lilium]RWX77060.1 XRE family transcriptional regulator [Neorhizobium lilium]